MILNYKVKKTQSGCANVRTLPEGLIVPVLGEKLSGASRLILYAN
jgi:hypothetical protein